MRRLFLLLLFFLSGVSGLIYQVTWVRQATLVFGVSVYAYSTVVAAFMAGMALGSYALRRYADHVAVPLRLYSIIQVAIAITGTLAPAVLIWLMPFYGAAAQSLPPDSALVTWLRALLSILVLTPPAFLMGATLPVMARAFAHRNRQVGGDVGQLYAADTLGAALGCALTGLFLLRTLGTRETIFVAAAINLLAALGAWLLSLRQKRPLVVQKQNSVSKGLAGNSPLTFIVFAYGLSGFAALGYEIVWTRILAVFTLDAVFSFSIVLSTFLTGLTVGGWLGAWWMRRRAARPSDFGSIQLGIAVLALLTLFVFERLPSLVLEDLFGAYSVTNVIYYEFLLGFVTILAPAVLLGILFPIVVSLYTAESIEHLSERIGVINALNTVGAIIGSLVAGFVMIPLLGLRDSVVALALFNLGLGIAVYASQSRRTARRWLLPAGAVIIAALMIVFLPAGYYLGFREGANEQMVFYDEGVETTVAVFDVPDQNFKVSFVNGRIEVPTDETSMRAFRLLGHLPPILNPNAKRALMLSFGNGIATGSLDTHDIEDVDVVDLSAEQFKAAEIYWEENYNVLRSNRVHRHVEDARNFLLQIPYQYDIITTDATHPTNTSSWALFTQEFYKSVASHMTADAVFMQWIPFHSLRQEDYKTILRTFQSVFPHASLWYTGGSHTFLLATPQPVTDEYLQEKLLAAADNVIVRDDIGPAPVLANFLAMDEDELRAYTGAGEIVTDNDAYFLPYDDEAEKTMQAIQEALAKRN